MGTQLSNTKILIGSAVFVGIVFFTASYFVEQNKKEVVASVTLAIVEQEKTLSNLAQITDKNGADPVVESIIVDCKLTDRMRFDELLGGLTSLTQTELKETVNLFDKCADFFAQRKKLMVARMEREYEVYESMVDMLSILDDPITITKFDVAGWKKIVDFEKRRSEIFSARVQIQESIISDLIAGKAPNSKEILNQVAEAQAMTEEVLVIDSQSDALRAKLLDL